MDALSILTVSTIAVRAALAVALIHLVAGPGRVLPSRSRAAWAVLAGFSTILAFDNAVVEILLRVSRGLPPDALITRVQFRVYNGTYLLHAALSAALPFGLIVALGRGTGTRRLMTFAVAAIGIFTLAGGFTGAMTEWERMLQVSRVLSFVAIGAYLGFWALLLLGHLREVDRYFAAFVAVRTFFILLLPIQEAVFEIVGRESVRQVWHVHQFLQFGASLVQLFVVLALARALSAGRRPEHMGAPVPG